MNAASYVIRGATLTGHQLSVDQAAQISTHLRVALAPVNILSVTVQGHLVTIRVTNVHDPVRFRSFQIKAKAELTKLLHTGAFSSHFKNGREAEVIDEI